ncbi:MAG TPA: ABC transporter substrate-binding protein [Terriglobia bacterium]|nr:ABC transporter substrate-binding protein [Terriglobia bacterium]
MDRRVFFYWLLSGVACAPFNATAQIAATVRRIGFLTIGTPFTREEVEEIIAPLRQRGWIEGKNLVFEQRYATKTELLRSLAEEFVQLKVDLIITEGTRAAIAAKNATKSIPIVMRAAGDPVLAGLVASLARPGGNVTGYSLANPEQAAKRLALLRELVPGIQRVGELENASNPYYASTRQHLREAYQSLAMEPLFVRVEQAARLEDAVAQVAQQRGQALYVPNDDLFDENALVIMRAALRYRLPTMVTGPEALEAGGLLSHSINFADRDFRVAAIVDKILRGANPADIPVEQPTRFELGINLKTAKVLGITVPQSLILRADKVIR